MIPLIRDESLEAFQLPAPHRSPELTLHSDLAFPTADCGTRECILIALPLVPGLQPAAQTAGRSAVLAAQVLL